MSHGRSVFHVLGLPLRREGGAGCWGCVLYSRWAVRPLQLLEKAYNRESREGLGVLHPPHLKKIKMPAWIKDAKDFCRSLVIRDPVEDLVGMLKHAEMDLDS